jgi:putative salt-induced outer membrane protein YdiY
MSLSRSSFTAVELPYDDAAMTRIPTALATLLVVSASTALAQAQPAAPKTWAVAASAGLSLTSGNSDTHTLNAAYDLTYDPQRRNVVKSDGLLLRGETAGTLSANRLGLNVRDEFRISTRTFVFGQNQYLRDEFKNIDYLLAPGGGIGYRMFDSEGTKLSVDAGVGGVWEKNPGVDVRTSGAVTVSEKFVRALTATATVTQTFTGLWKTKDWDDSLLTFGAGIAVAISERTQLKVEVLDTYKNLPPVATVQKNDVAVLMAIVFKM